MANTGAKSLASTVETRRQATTALLLCVFLGYLGAHRFYLKKYGSGALYLVTAGIFLFGWIADIVSLVRRRSALMTAGAVDRELVLEDARGEGQEPDDLERRREEDEARRHELQEANKEFLRSAGVNVEMFTPDKVIADAMAIIEGLCSPMSRFDHGLRDEVPYISFSSPTRTGRVPKNVVEAGLSHEVVRMVPSDFEGLSLPEYGDRLGISICYLANGDINKSDINGWHEGHGVSIGVRNVDGVLSISSVGAIDLSNHGEWQSLCVKPNPTSDELFDALEKEVKRIYR